MTNRAPSLCTHPSKTKHPEIHCGFFTSSISLPILRQFIGPICHYYHRLVPLFHIPYDAIQYANLNRNTIRTQKENKRKQMSVYQRLDPSDLPCISNPPEFTARTADPTLSGDHITSITLDIHPQRSRDITGGFCRISS